MRLLICTQAVDRSDPVLGFFHPWIEALAPHCESVEVVCLKEGERRLPGNVAVHSLGKERGRVSSWRYAARFLRLAWRLRSQHDTVFVHMNQEYVLLAGLLWRLSGKRVVLWRNHKMGSLLTGLAARLAHAVCYTSPSAYVANRRNAVRMPVGIDTGLFKPGTPREGSLLFLGRLDPVKRPELFFDALSLLADERVAFQASMYGEPTDPAAPYAAEYAQKAAGLAERGVLTMHKSVRNDETPAIYATHAVYINLTPSGSFDKTIGEAMAAGCVVVVTNDAVRSALPERLIVDGSAQSVADSIRHALALTPQERSTLVANSRAYVEREHSLALLVQKLVGILTQ